MKHRSSARALLVAVLPLSLLVSCGGSAAGNDAADQGMGTLPAPQTTLPLVQNVLTELDALDADIAAIDDALAEIGSSTTIPSEVSQ